jgi:alkylhydroperoxidase/carboxymuconolactone decarboxylase family protein YurZ
MSSSDSLAKRLDAIRNKRGYLLPHHGLMAISEPELLDAYDQTYIALTLKDRALSLHHHEAVWLAILIAKREGLATHHLAKFRSAGGSEREVGAILGLTAMLEGFPAYGFVQQHWQAHLSELDVRETYLDSFKAGSAGLSEQLAILCAIAVHASLGHWEALNWQIKSAYELSVPELEMAEALSLMMFPGSVPYFARAAACWRQLILSGDVQASADFRAWAEISGQGGFDEAAGLDAGSEA